MGRKPTPQPLAISPASLEDEENNIIEPGPKSAPSLRSPRSPRSPFRFSTKLGQGFGDHPSMQPAEEHEHRRNFSSSPTTPSQQSFRQPSGSDGQEGRSRGQEQARPSTSPSKGGFFSNYKASKSSSRLQPVDTIRQVAEEPMSRDTDQPIASAKVASSEPRRRDPSADKTITRRPVANNSRSDLSLNSQADSAISGTNNPNTTPTTTPNTITKRGKQKPFFSSLNRTRSIRGDGQSPGETTPIVIHEPERERAQPYGGMRTAPLRPEHDRTFRDLMSSSVRNRSADRQPQTARPFPTSDKEHRDNGRNPSSFRENGGQGFLNNLKNYSSSKAVGIGRGFLNKVSRSGSTNEREPPVDDEHYVLKVINLPLVEQTRLTRISKKLEESRDKTEFWMPAFPWRAIDYLNYRGTETEGLYRVPGSGPQIKKWQRRFDEELDIDLFEQEDLYDINIIGSMLKAWLRELPDELFPKASQDKIARECAGADKVPQLLVDELSNLRPFNYYLLFAITCHLSLLLAHSDKNKMDFRNLCICFQPCMKIDAFCFKFLVVDWRDCWKGCKTEDEWLAKEHTHSELLPPSSGEGRSSTAVESHDERNISSSDSSKPPSVGPENPASSKPVLKNKPQNLLSSQSNHSIISSDTSSTTTTLTVKDSTPSSNNGDMTLQPIPPLSPMTF